MTNSNQVSLEFPALKTGLIRRKIEVQFSGGEVTSDGGVLLLRDTANLAEDANVQLVDQHYLDSIELLVMQYIKTADIGYL